MPKVDRRAFLVSAAAVGGALTLGFDIACDPPAQAGTTPPEITCWIVIALDDRVTVRIARSEMGQGIFTALPMLVAEELGCDWSKVGAEFVPPQENLRRRRIWGDMSTGGSRSVRTSQEILRKAGATAREMLIAAAAARWDTATSDCAAHDSLIVHKPSGRTLRFGEIAAAAATITPPRSVRLKEPHEWTLIGTSRKRLDVADKVTGRPIYAIDVRLPGMLYAALAQCPVFGGKLVAADEAGIMGRRGVRQVVKFDDAVAVVAESWWQAKTALEALPVKWDPGANINVSSDSIAAMLRAGLDADDAGVGREQGDITAGLAQSATRLTADYHLPYLAHATLEPQNCTAQVMGDGVDLWVPTQHGESALSVAANAAGVPPANVRVHKMMLGGGFGRRGIVQDFIPHAVKIAQQVGVPVQTIWSREEDMRHDYYRPTMMARMTAGLDAAGLPHAWHVRLCGNSIIHTLFAGGFVGGVDRQAQEGFTADMPYDVANYRVDFVERNAHVPVGFWRGVSHTQNCFFKESFIDEMAHAARQDPYLYRRRLIGRHLHAAKFIAVLDAAAQRARWSEPAPAGLFRGIAIEQVDDAFITAVAEVSVSAQGALEVHRFVCAIDCGHVVNPMTVERQIESGVAFGLTAALYGEIGIKDGRVVQGNFDGYRMLRLAAMPKVETVLVPSGGFWGGVGEPPSAIVAPAVCNAIFAATGRRIRTLPLMRHDLRKI
ncbi:MAG TPA: xanthine dehydrogenase family protein molybdopterin-binding subunit [Xanthobacteraceae bacterium]|nr:xanthine dehydrogenase family protein molybdopterin-binding subunit [Xanthobacteraceae bacterium]